MNFRVEFSFDLFEHLVVHPSKENVLIADGKKVVVITSGCKSARIRLEFDGVLYIYWNRPGYAHSPVVFQIS